MPYPVRRCRPVSLPAPAVRAGRFFPACCGVLCGVGAVSLGLMAAEPPAIPPGTTFYSTAAPPTDFDGPKPVHMELALVEGDSIAAADANVAPAADTTAAPEPPPETKAPGDGAPRLASSVGPALKAPEVKEKPADPIAQAMALVARGKSEYATVRDYTCTFFKRERIEGRMTPQYVMQMKARTRPMSVYFKFAKPHAGREAIYVAGRNGGKVLVHDVGLGKLLAGTLAIEPRSARAMEDNRHPVTEAGLGHLLTTLEERWGAEMRPGETHVVIHTGAKVGNRTCTMVESTHPRKAPAFLFHKVKIYFDDENGLPVRFESYDWPRRPGAAPDLLEEYTYANLRTNVGLRESDFDASNAQYSFGRF